MVSTPVRREESLSGDAARPHGRASVLGGLMSVVGLAMALVTALGLNDLASGRLGIGLGLLAVAAGGRWLSGEWIESWFVRTARRLRQHWRARVVAFFLVPGATTSPSPVEIATAIDTVVDQPRLAVVRASAQASVLALVVVWLSGGWQALSIVVVLLAVAVPLYVRAGQRAAVYDVLYRERRERLAERQLELLTHAPELRALGAVRYGAEEIAALSRSEHEVALRAIRAALGSSLVTEFLAGVSVGLVAMDVGFGLLAGRISLVRALVSVLATSEFFTHVRRFGVEFHRREAIDAATARLVSPPEDDPDVSEVLQVVDLITLAHPQPLTLSLRPGERVAVLGASGVGKTTLAHTLLGWREARGGRVARTRGAVAYISAETSLVEGSLRDNLCLGRDIADERVRTLLSSLHLRGERFDQLDQPVSADGEGFSSGERIRLLIARALLVAPRLLVLDDVAGLLDVAARGAVRDELDRHHDLAVIEAAVDETVFITASTTVRLS